MNMHRIFAHKLQLEDVELHVHGIHFTATCIRYVLVVTFNAATRPSKSSWEGVREGLMGRHLRDRCNILKLYNIAGAIFFVPYVRKQHTQRPVLSLRRSRHSSHRLALGSSLASAAGIRKNKPTRVQAFPRNLTIVSNVHLQHTYYQLT